MAYSTSRCLASAIQESARGRGGQSAMTEFFAQRLIARLATAFPDQWVLKGGHAMVARLPDVARTTRDIDGALASTSRDTAIAELGQAAKTTPEDPDFLEFELVTSGPGHVEDLASLSFRARFGGKAHGTVKLDVQLVRDRQELGELVPLGRRVDPPKQGGWPERVRVVSVADHMAEKLVALYSIHNGRPSSRERDVVDLALLAWYAPPRPGALEPALDRALSRPTVPSVTVELPPRFIVPDRFRPVFERDAQGLSWETSMQEIAAVTDPAFESHGGRRRRSSDGAGAVQPTGSAREAATGPGGEESAGGDSGAVYVRPHSRGGHQVSGHWRAAPGGSSAETD